MKSKYNVTIWLSKKAEDGTDKVHLTFDEEEIKKVKKSIKSKRYDGSFNMKNGDIVEIEKSE